MSYDKKYYDDKKLVLSQRLSKKKDDLINEIIALNRQFLQDQNDIMSDFQEIIEEEKKQNPEVESVSQPAKKTSK